VLRASGLNGDATKLRFRQERANVGRRNYANLELDMQFANLRAGLFARLIKVSRLLRAGSRCFVHLQITFAISHRSALERFRLMRLIYLKVARNDTTSSFVSRGKRVVALNLLKWSHLHINLHNIKFIHNICNYEYISATFSLIIIVIITWLCNSHDRTVFTSEMYIY